MHHTERELRQIAAGALLTLNDLFKSLPKLSENIEVASSDQTSPAKQLVRKPKISHLRKVSKVDERDALVSKWWPNSLCSQR